MKTIVLVRHGQSGLASATGLDIDRTLDGRGEKEAAFVAHRLIDRKIIPEFFMSSPATRALDTAAIFLNELGRPTNDLQQLPYLYEPSVGSFYTAIEQLPPALSTAIIFSHNAGISDFITDLDCGYSPAMPTCGMYTFNLIADDWNAIRFETKQFLFFEYPQG